MTFPVGVPPGPFQRLAVTPFNPQRENGRFSSAVSRRSSFRDVACSSSPSAFGTFGATLESGRSSLACFKAALGATRVAGTASAPELGAAAERVCYRRQLAPRARQEVVFAGQAGRVLIYRAQVRHAANRRRRRHRQSGLLGHATENCRSRTSQLEVRTILTTIWKNEIPCRLYSTSVCRSKWRCFKPLEP